MGGTWKEMGLEVLLLEDSSEEISFRTESEEEVWQGFYPEALFARFIDVHLLNDSL